MVKIDQSCLHVCIVREYMKNQLNLVMYDTSKCRNKNERNLVIY